MTSIPTPRKTYFGLASLAAALVSVMFLGGSYAITILDISASAFSRLNNLTYLIYCIATPLAVALGIFSFRKKNDLRSLALIALGLTVLPFLVLFWQFITSLIRSNPI